MDPNVSTLERAFQLAASRRYATVGEIKLCLQKEGYRQELIEGPVLYGQLTEAIAKARSTPTRRAKLKTGRRA